MSKNELALSQLIAIRHQSLEVLRKDLMTLLQLAKEAEETLASARKAEEAFQERLRTRESDASALDPTQMLAWRRYWEHLQQQVNEVDESLAKVSAEVSKAQAAFDAAYAEVRTLERLAERRQDAQKQETQRLGYLAADDLEVLRGAQKGNAHGIN